MTRDENDSREKNPKIKQRWRLGSIIFGIYTLLLLFQFPQFYFYISKRSVLIWEPLIQYIFAVYLWALLTPVVLWVGRAFPVNRKHWIRNVSLHLIFGLAISTTYVYLSNLLPALFFNGSLSKIIDKITLPYFTAAVTTHIIFYTAVTAIYQTFLQLRKIQSQEFRLQQAELQTLKTQLQPHFLFNTINAISALIHVEPETADETLTELSDLLRLSLKNDKQQETLLRDELFFLRKYLRIHQTLMKERLEIRWQIDPATPDALIPSMILQPLVENSILHGIAPLERGGCIQIKAEQVDGKLLLEVKDNGAGLAKPSRSKGGGIGLVNTKARISHLYGDDQEFSLEQLPEGGVGVIIKLPFNRKKYRE